MGPSVPCDPAAPGRPSGPALPLSPCKKRDVTEFTVTSTPPPLTGSRPWSYPLSYETVLTRRTFGTRHTLQKTRVSARCSTAFFKQATPNISGSRRISFFYFPRPQVQVLLLALWLLVHRLPRRILVLPEVQQFQVFLVVPEVRPVFKLWVQV